MRDFVVSVLVVLAWVLIIVGVYATPRGILREADVLLGLAAGVAGIFGLVITAAALVGVAISYMRNHC